VTVRVEGAEPGGEAWVLSAASPAELAGRALFRERLTAGGGLTGCLACGHAELYGQRDFPRALGLAIVIAAAALAPFTAYLSLAAAALLDALLYWAGPSVVVCYVCGARHKGFAPEPRHPRYDLGIAERLRYGPKAVMGKPMRAGGTAGAPEPEH
jgi:hypothetical protein